MKREDVCVKENCKEDQDEVFFFLLKNDESIVIDDFEDFDPSYNYVEFNRVEWCVSCDKNREYEHRIEAFKQLPFFQESESEKIEESINSKPEYYAKQGVDTFARMEANRTLEECIGFAIGNIDKYNMREKPEQELKDCDKIIAYATWKKKLLEKKLGK